LREGADVVVDTLSTFTRGVVDFFGSSKHSDVVVVIVGAVMTVLVCLDVDADIYDSIEVCRIGDDRWF
jgi:hypothetical protein